MNAIFVTYHNSTNIADYFKSAIISEESLKDFETMFDDPDTLLIVAEQNGQIVGFCAASFSSWEESEKHYLRKYLFVRQINVVEGFRKQGIGSKMLAEVEKLAKAKEILDFELVTWSSLGVKDFYEHRGYKVERIILRKTSGPELG